MDNSNQKCTMNQCGITVLSSPQFMQNQFNAIPLFSSQSDIWKTSLATSKQHLSTSINGYQPIKKTILSILASGLGLQGNRNLLIANIPQNYYGFVSEVMTGHHQDFISNTFAKHCLGTVTMAVLFYGMDQAKQCYEQLTHLTESIKEFNLVAVSFCTSITVSATFDIELEKLQDTHLLVSLSGALSTTAEINYEGILETFGELHQLETLEQSEVSLALIVEYKDTRHTVKAHSALHDTINKGIVFSTHLTKFEVEHRKARTIQRSIELGIASQYSTFSGIDNQQWIPSLPTPYPLLQAPSSLFPSPSNQQYQLASSHSMPIHFAIQSKNIIAPQTNMFCMNSPYHFQSPTVPDSNMALPIAMHHSNNSKNTYTHQNDNNIGSNQQLSPASLVDANYQDLGLKNTPVNNNSGLDTTTEKEGSVSFGLFTPLSLPSVELSVSATSSQPFSNDNNTTMEAAIIRHYSDVLTDNRSLHFDVDKVINNLDNRTTFMIRNIPNKYTQDMFMECIDVTHRKTYDFLYLRMDFKNRCNVGYAFINFINYKSVISFSKRMVGKHWNRFNSEKKCFLSYAKIQGKTNLIEKFRKSKVMEQHPSFQPMIFHSSGPHQGEREEFPSLPVVSVAHTPPL